MQFVGFANTPPTCAMPKHGWNNNTKLKSYHWLFVTTLLLLQAIWPSRSVQIDRVSLKGYVGGQHAAAVGGSHAGYH